MSINYTIRPRQTLADAVLQETGTLEGYMAVCVANNVSPSDIPAEGTPIVIPDGVATDRTALEYLAEREITIGTMGTMAGLPSGSALLAEDGATTLETEDGDTILPE